MGIDLTNTASGHPGGLRSVEVRVINEKTGGQKGLKDIRWDLVPIEPMQEVARLYNEGAKKYAKDNWRKGYDWSLSYAAMQRHATQFWNGESYDEETGCHHLSSVVFHALALMEFEKTHPELDDRYLDHIKPKFSDDSTP